ncbi:MarR family transcriptional regulator [Herbiconiux sp. P17]|uniref:MarR family transcriptional regulator n=1 Tax=Herbiconiux wuyangfengii TaxID=3342794 RepID=UPI0035BA91D8
MTRESVRAVWAVGADEASHRDFPGHVAAIAHGRFVLRQVLKILDDCAVQGGLQPLSHQALLQTFGAPEPISVSGLAERLAVPPALVSRIVRGLEEDGLVQRSRISDDKRVVVVSTTAAGIERLREIDQHVHEEIRRLSDSLDDAGRLGALATFASYVGLDADPRITPLFAGIDAVTHS